MYGFILNMWCMKKIDERTVRSYVPMSISKQEADMILVTPHWEGYNPVDYAVREVEE